MEGRDLSSELTLKVAKDGRLGNLATPISVQKLQTALHAKAKEEPGFRFYALYDKIYRMDVLRHAYACCRANKGARGVDGLRFDDIEAYGRERWLGELAQEIQEGTYRPDAVRRVYIPKPDGKFDSLGYTFGLCYSRKTGRAYIGARPSKKSIKRMIEAVHVETCRTSTWLDAEELVTRLNRKLGGWANYFRYGPVTSAYRFIDWYTTNRLRRWLCKKHKQSGKGNERYPDEYLYKHLRLIRLPILPKSFPWAKA